MYAVIETGGKQYRVEVGTELEVELLDVEPGKTITLDRVLLVADGDESSIGPPARRGRRGQRRGPAPEPRPEAHLLQVPAQGAQPRQEGPSPGADRPAHQRHHVRRQERREVPPRPRTTPRPSASASRRPRPPAQAAKDAELAAKLAVGVDGPVAKARPQGHARRRSAKAATATKPAAPAKPAAQGDRREGGRRQAGSPRPAAKAGAARQSQAAAAKKAAAREGHRPRPRRTLPKRPRATKKDE